MFLRETIFSFFFFFYRHCETSLILDDSSSRDVTKTRSYQDNNDSQQIDLWAHTYNTSTQRELPVTLPSEFFESFLKFSVKKLKEEMNAHTLMSMMKQSDGKTKLQVSTARQMFVNDVTLRQAYQDYSPGQIYDQKQQVKYAHVHILCTSPVLSGKNALPVDALLFMAWRWEYFAFKIIVFAELENYIYIYIYEGKFIVELFFTEN